MARVRMTGQGELVPYTDAEEAEADARDEATAAAKTAADAAAPMNAWLAAMAQTDSYMSRAVEDLIDSLVSADAITAEQLSATLTSQRASKKTERAKKPGAG